MNMPQGKQIGVLSTDLKEVFPNLIKHTLHPACGNSKQEIEFDAVNYSALIPVLVQGIKELSEKENFPLVLEDKLLKQEKKIDALTTELNSLKTLLNDLCNFGCEGFSHNISPVNSDAILYQSIPNPANNSALIGYSINIPFNSAYIVVNTIDGTVVKEFQIYGNGIGSFLFEPINKSDGIFKYSLFIDGKLFNTKSIVMLKN